MVFYSGSKLPRVLFYVTGGALVAVVVLAFFFGAYDLMRYIVLGEIAAVVLMMLMELGVRTIPNHRVPPEYHKAIRLAYAGRIVACIVMAEAVVQRIGHAELNPMTPLTQLALIFWTLSVAQSRIRPVKSEPRAVVEAISERIGVQEDKKQKIAEEIEAKERERGDK